MPAKPEDLDEAPPPGLFEQIGQAAERAQELAPLAAPGCAGIVSDELVPWLHQARTYVEVGRLRDREVHDGLANAIRVTHLLADIDRRFAPLVSRLRAILEEADATARDL